MVSFSSNNEPLFISSHWPCVLGKAAPVFNLGLCVGGGRCRHQSRGGCDVKAQGVRDLVELSAADASNPDKAKSANSVSLILVYICLPVPAVQPCPPPPWQGLVTKELNKFFHPTAPLPNPHPPYLLSLTPSLPGQARESLSPSAVIMVHPGTPLHLLRVWLPLTPSPYRNSAPVLAPVLQSKLSSTIES